MSKTVFHNKNNSQQISSQKLHISISLSLFTQVFVLLLALFIYKKYVDLIMCNSYTLKCSLSFDWLNIQQWSFETYSAVLSNVRMSSKF